MFRPSLSSWYAVLSVLILLWNAQAGNQPHQYAFVPRGGASTKLPSSSDAYDLLAEFVQQRFPEEDVDKLSDVLGRLASVQQTFKGLDGAAHEAYQRTHSSEDIDTGVSGRAQRSASRLAATAEALMACELVELVEHPDWNTTETLSLENRKVLVNITVADSKIALGKSKLAVLVLHEPNYDGGVGLDHGTIVSLADEPQGRKPRGRLLIVLADTLSNDPVEILSLLDQKPRRIRLSSGLVTDEVASVQSTLYKAAGRLLTELEPQLREYNNTAVHFIGRSLSGGVASLASAMLDGSIPLPKAKGGKKKTKSEEAATETSSTLENDNNKTETIQEPEPLSGLGRARSSSMTLGAPPCLSSNVLAAFCTSILYGDDVVCRSTKDSIDRLYERIDRNIGGGFVGRNIGWMSDTLSMTVSSLKTHAHGSEGEEAKLSVPGRAFLVRPRRLGGFCSIHEVGNLKKGGREALRANLLWQLQDVLLSKSMWKHHSLDAYIHGLDRVQLRGIGEEGSEELMY